MQERRARSVFAKIRPGNRKCGVSRFLMCKYTEFQKKNDFAGQFRLSSLRPDRQDDQKSRILKNL